MGEFSAPDRDYPAYLDEANRAMVPLRGGLAELRGGIALAMFVPKPPTLRASEGFRKCKRGDGASSRAFLGPGLFTRSSLLAFASWYPDAGAAMPSLASPADIEALKVAARSAPRIEAGEKINVIVYQEDSLQRPIPGRSKRLCIFALDRNGAGCRGYTARICAPIEIAIWKQKLP